MTNTTHMHAHMRAYQCVHGCCCGARLCFGCGPTYTLLEGTLLQAAFDLKQYSGTARALLDLLDLDPSTAVRLQVCAGPRYTSSCIYDRDVEIGVVMCQSLFLRNRNGVMTLALVD